MKKLVMSMLTAIFALTLACPVFAAEPPHEAETAAAYLRENGILQGNEHGDMMLSSGLTRAQLAAILTRMTVDQGHLEADKAFYEKQCTFTDVPEWARSYVGFCATNHLMTGYGNGLFGPADPVTPAAACTVMLRCLEDVEGDWNYSTACQKAVAEGLTEVGALTAPAITRGSMAILIYRTMARMGYDVNAADAAVAGALSRNADGSINLPSDGSRYVPQAGDVIRCDDGANYAVTDVSRYDRNYFASGPAGDLPEPTCDWSLLAQPELPPAEARHFQLETGEYLFVRNLYETRRMLYTLYNAVGDNPETWQNGAPVLHSSGSSKVKINLTIGEGLTFQSFWPWRASEIIDLFNSCPPGTYSMECWDVYKDGVFQRTEYQIRVTRQ
jgi:hypothetical protein